MSSVGLSLLVNVVSSNELGSVVDSAWVLAESLEPKIFVFSSTIVVFGDGGASGGDSVEGNSVIDPANILFMVVDSAEESILPEDISSVEDFDSVVCCVSVVCSTSRDVPELSC